MTHIWQKAFFKHVLEHKENSTDWFVLISNDIREAAEALLAYRRKDAVEKNGWTRNHNLQEIFSEMKSLKQVDNFV